MQQVNELGTSQYVQKHHVKFKDAYKSHLMGIKMRNQKYVPLREQRIKNNAQAKKFIINTESKHYPMCQYKLCTIPKNNSLYKWISNNAPKCIVNYRPRYQQQQKHPFMVKNNNGLNFIVIESKLNALSEKQEIIQTIATIIINNYSQKKPQEIEAKVKSYWEN